MYKRLFFLVLTFCALGAAAQDTESMLSDWLAGRFYPSSVYDIRPMSDGEHFTAMSMRRIEKFSYATGKKTGVLATLPPGARGYELSCKEDKILFYSSPAQIYRHSFSAMYSVMDIATGKCQPLFEQPQRDASLSADGSMAAFIAGNNILIKNLSSGNITRVTGDGEEGSIINGAPDWVYEEEFGFSKAYEFSPCGKYIAYIKFNEKDVKSCYIPYYPDFSMAAGHGNYPALVPYKYPKAGEANSAVSVHIYCIATGKTIEAGLGPDDDIYVPRIQWIANTGKLCICRMNRLQNTLDLLSMDPSSGKTEPFLQISDPRYIEEDVMRNIIFIKGGKEVILISEQDGCRRLHRYGISGNHINAISPQGQDVIEPYGYCESSETVYYKGVGLHPAQTAIYAASISGKDVAMITKESGSYDAEFSCGFKYFVSFFSNASTPTRVSVCTASGNQVRVLEDNASLKRDVEAMGGIRKEFFSWENSDGQQLYAYIIRPLGFDSSKKYPVLVTGYNGPNSNEVNDEFCFDWLQILSRKGFVIACTDTRGTGRRGSDFRKCTYGQLGALESKDLADFADYLGSKDYIDKNRLGIYGWSYGGFMVSSVMTRYPGAYKAGIAIAPVESWEYYDNIYTERYMGLPAQNVSGYKDNSPIKYAANLSGKLLLVYGTADDNVHPHNSMAFSNALIRAGKDFDLMVYPNSNHGLYGPNNRRHLYTKAIRFLMDNL